MSTPFLSVILPAYNEEKRLTFALDQLLNFLKAQPYTHEVIVVENGSHDQTFRVAQEYARKDCCLHVLQNNERGKGLAVQRGMLSATGAYRFMCDVDFSMPVTEINRFLPPALGSYDIAIASREAPGAKRYHEPAYRHLVGRIYNTMIRLMAVPGLQDTQCGFKCFTGPVAEDLFHHQTLSGWSFDVELLYIARRRGYRIREVPIPWYFNSESKIKVLQDSFRMGLDLLNIRLNGLRGVYEGKV